MRIHATINYCIVLCIKMARRSKSKSTSKRNKTSLPVAEGNESQHGYSHDLTEPPAEVSTPERQLHAGQVPLPEDPPRPQRQVRLTCSKTKDNNTPPPSGAHEGGNEQGAPARNLLPPVQAAGSSTSTTDSPGRRPGENHDVSCLCGMSKNLEGGLLVQCDTCNKWAHS